MIPTLRVRKRRTNGKITYRFTKGNIGWSRKDMEAVEGLEFDFAPTMNQDDINAVNETWAHKMKHREQIANP